MQGERDPDTYDRNRPQPPVRLILTHAKYDVARYERQQRSMSLPIHSKASIDMTFPIYSNAIDKAGACLLSVIMGIGIGTWR